jgi:sec-independent protein translocase protein TatB
MFGIGFPELIIILIVALLVVGPTKLPEVARSVGRALGEFRRMADDVKETLEQEMDKEDEHKEEAPGQSGEQKVPDPPQGGQAEEQKGADPYSGQHGPGDAKKDESDPHAQKGA